MINDWQCSVDSIQAILENEFFNVIIDKINEVAIDQMGDSLIFEENGELKVLDEYRDDLIRYGEHKNLLVKQIDTELIDGDWEAFIEQMQPHYWNVVAIILDGNDISNQIHTIAVSNNQTENLLIDEINEIAYNTIGDILIDTRENLPILIEDEIDSIKKLLNLIYSSTD